MMAAGEEALFCARIGDYLARAAKGAFCCSSYLTPREQMIARRMAAGASLFAWGGYAEAERRRLFFLPEFVPEPEEKGDEGWLALAEMYFPGDVAGAVCRLRIDGSGYRVLSHRDYLGSLLGLGIERSAVGDIVPVGDFSAVLFCDGKIAEFLCMTLERIGADKVKIVADTDTPLPCRTVRPIADTIASPRLDCVVAALTHLSREKAQTMIRTGEVEVDFFPEVRTDAEVCEGAMLSLRGFGRFRVTGFDGETRRGRLRLRAEQWI